MTFTPESKSPTKDPDRNQRIITAYIGPKRKAAFREYCKNHNISVSRCVQQLMDYAMAGDKITAPIADVTPSAETRKTINELYKYREGTDAC